MADAGCSDVIHLRHRPCVTCIVAASLAACSSEPPTRSVAQTDVIAYRELLEDVVAATTHYRAVMMDPGMTACTCGSFHRDYDDKMRWFLDQMPAFAGDMDAIMMDHQAGRAADVERVTDAMRDELDQHARVACTWTDLASDRAEAARHVDAMLVLTTHATERCDEMQNGLDGHGWSWGE